MTEEKGAEIEIEPGYYVRHSNYNLDNPPYNLPPEIIIVTREYETQGDKKVRVIKHPVGKRETLPDEEIARDFSRIANLRVYLESKKSLLHWVKRKDTEELAKRVSKHLEEVEKAQEESGHSTHIFMGPQQGK